MIRTAITLLLLALLFCGCVIEERVEKPDEVPMRQPRFTVESLDYKCKKAFVRVGDADQSGYVITFEAGGKILDKGWRIDRFLLGAVIAQQAVVGEVVVAREKKIRNIQYVTPVFVETSGTGEGSYDKKAELRLPARLVEGVEFRVGRPEYEDVNEETHAYKPFTPVPK